MLKERRVSVYKTLEEIDTKEAKIIAQVRFNRNLDTMTNYGYGSATQSKYYIKFNTKNKTGQHKGLTKLQDGQYVLIESCDWTGPSGRDVAYIISAEEALQQVLKSGNTELLKTKKFKALGELAKKELVSEDGLIKEEE